MESIFDDKFYTSKTWPAYIETHSGLGQKGDTVFYFYGITPTGRVSKYWAAYSLSYGFSKEQKERKLNEYIKTRRPKLPKGYRWSKPKLYAGNF